MDEDPVKKHATFAAVCIAQTCFVPAKLICTFVGEQSNFVYIFVMEILHEMHHLASAIKLNESFCMNEDVLDGKFYKNECDNKIWEKDLQS